MACEMREAGEMEPYAVSILVLRCTPVNRYARSAPRSYRTVYRGRHDVQSRNRYTEKYPLNVSFELISPVWI